MRPSESDLEHYRKLLACNFQQIHAVFAECMEEAGALLTPAGIEEYLDGAGLVCKIGRGYEPVLVYLEELPAIAQRLGEGVLSMTSDAVWKISRSPNGKAILPFLQSLPEAARRLGSLELFRGYILLVFEFMERTTSSIHGFHTTIPSPGLPAFLERIPQLLTQLNLCGLRNWVEYGIRNYSRHPERQRDYFSLVSADSRAMLMRERHGTLFVDHERELDHYLRALWNQHHHLVPYATDTHRQPRPLPYYDKLGIRVPDVYDDHNGIRGIDRYRVLLAHIAAHLRWSSAIIADNFSPLQRMAIETFEDSRVDWLTLQIYPGLRRIWLALHPKPGELDCDASQASCVRHRLALFSRAVIDPEHGYRHPDLLEFIQAFHELVAQPDTGTPEIADLAIRFVARTRRQADQQARVYFADTEVDYRDDNRHLWLFIEEGDEEEWNDEQRKEQSEEELNRLPPRHYPEWDYQTQLYRPDWVSLYESLHGRGDAGYIDQLLAKHEALVKQLTRLLDLLKPQQYVRVRFQEEGSELDLDVAIRSLVDFKSGSHPDPRINMSHRHDGRNIAVMLLLDLSESLAQVPEGAQQSILELSQEAVSILSWAIERLGDEFAIAGFSSNTRHEVRYQHIKGYSEHWGDEVKSRLAAMEAGYSTRMGAALRHAGFYLGKRKADKKLLLVLTDGEPSDIDVEDSRLLIQDSRKAVQELSREGIYTHCINLDPRADDYVADIFGQRFTVIDRVEQLPEKLPRLFMSLTG